MKSAALRLAGLLLEEQRLGAAAAAGWTEGDGNPAPRPLSLITWPFDQRLARPGCSLGLISYTMFLITAAMF